jgi:hypothetical protein
MIADHDTHQGGLGRFLRMAREGAGLDVFVTNADASFDDCRRSRISERMAHR